MLRIFVLFFVLLLGIVLVSFKRARSDFRTRVGIVALIIVGVMIYGVASWLLKVWSN